MDATILKLTGVGAGETRVAIGQDATDAAYPIEAFEASDFEIDCGFSSNISNSANLGIAVYGRHIFLHDIRVVNFGGNISGAFLSVISAADRNSENCVIARCTVQSPADNAGTQSSMALFGFGGSSAKPSRFCVIRECLGRGTGTGDASSISPAQFGILPGAGLGTLIERNELVNVGHRVYSRSATEPDHDIIISGNYFRNVSNGIVLDRTTGTIGSIMAMGNTVELKTSSGTASYGIHLKANAASRYKQAIVRKNAIGQIENPPGENTDLNGLRFEGCDDLNAEENVINNAPAQKAVTFANCLSAKFFSNQNTAGQLLRAFDGTRYKLELADEVQDVLLATGSSTWRL